MKFIHEEFMLENTSASRLYHEYAEKQPIIDYHCHLDPQEISEDKSWENITQVWLYGDHYKWRAMRSNGIDERFCTGTASDWEKFKSFSEIMPFLLRNPLYHWSHLELARSFKIDNLLLSEKTAQEVWDRSSEILQDGLSARQLMKNNNVLAVCTTDDPADSLEHHIKISESESFTRVLPTWRPDNALAIEKESWPGYIRRLSEVSDTDISSYDDLIESLSKRHRFFHDTGCRLSDHSLETFFITDYNAKEVRNIFTKAVAGKSVSIEESRKFKTALMLEFGRMDAEKGWTKQMHIGALRNNSSRMYNILGPDSGFDSIDDQPVARPLGRLLDMLDRENSLPKTILYNLNPKDNEVIATMIGNFQDGRIAGKIQFGSGWWFMDQKNGIERQIEALSQLGSLGRFVGMLTDSRSFLSYSRHEYFRRILCSIIGRDMEAGMIPDDFQLAGKLVEDICYGNASRYFGFDLNQD